MYDFSIIFLSVLYWTLTLNEVRSHSNIIHMLSWTIIHLCSDCIWEELESFIGWRGSWQSTNPLSKSSFNPSSIWFKHWIQVVSLARDVNCANKLGKHIKTVQTHWQVEAKSMQADTHAIDHVWAWQMVSVGIWNPYMTLFSFRSSSEHSHTSSNSLMLTWDALVWNRNALYTDPQITVHRQNHVPERTS